jgi:dipeptidase E
MKFYLSSFKFGNKRNQIKNLAPKGRIAVIPNALDFRDANDERTTRSIKNKVERLKELGLQAEVVNLKHYFGREEDLRQLIEDIGAVFVLGGNVFVLRQAMKLSGLDNILTILRDNPDFLYAGYSAAGCVLAPSLEPYKVVGDATVTPYKELNKVIWDGLGFVDFAFMPHWESDHPETEAIARGLEYCKQNSIKYKALRDGEVLLL